MSLHNFSSIPMCALIFYFANMIRLNFEFNLDSNGFANYTKDLKMVKLSYSLIRPWVEI
jgi:hypothetical protein